MRDTPQERGGWFNRLALILCTITFAAIISAAIIYPERLGGVDLDTENDGPPTPVPQGFILIDQRTPLAVAIISEPTEPAPTFTPTAIPKPTATPEQTPQLDFCGALPPKDGQICRVPLPTASPSPTMPTCESPEAEAGELCQYRFAPTPVSSNTPTTVAQTVTVPDMLSLSPVDAGSMLVQSGLRGIAVCASHTQGADPRTVVGTDPGFGTVIEPGTIVILYLNPPCDDAVPTNAPISDPPSNQEE